MIPKIIHQIFLSVNGSKIEDNYIFMKGRRKWISWCMKNGYVYKYHNGDNITRYLQTDEQREFYFNLKYTWQKIDFIRYCIINKEGGVYIDLDIFPKEIYHDNFGKYIQRNEYIVGVWFDKKNKKLQPSNSIIGFKKNKLNDLIKYSMEQTLLKSQMPIYDTWKIRYMKHTTGVCMFMRWVKKKGLSFTLKLHDFVKDLETATWTKNFG